MLLYVLRHGITQWNKLKKVQGAVDIPLAPEGIKLAKKTGEALKDIHFDICFTSPLTRAKHEMEVFFTDPLKFKRPENGENISDILKRTREFWQEKITDPALTDKTVLVSSHGCAVRALLQNIYQDHENFWHGCVPPNCSINLVEVKDGKVRLLEEDKVYSEINK